MAILTAAGCTDSAAAPEAQLDPQSGPELEPAQVEAPVQYQRPADATFEDVLSEYLNLNERLARVAAPLRLKNAKLCPRTRRDPGFTLHRLDDYPPVLRPMAESFLGIKSDGLYVRAVRPETSAAKAHVKPGDQILAVNANPISNEPLMETYNRAVLRNGFESVLSKVQIGTKSGREFLARIRPKTACDIPAKVVFSNDVNGHTDGKEVLITSALMRAVPDDTNLALVIAHEMSHVIAGHFKQVPSQTLELDADRMALVLMARAGYDIEAAVGFWERAVHPHDGGQNSQSSHPSTQARYKNFQSELKRIMRHGDIETLGF